MVSELLDVQAVAARLHVRPARVYALARAGLLPVVRLGRQVRVSASVLDEWIRTGGQALAGGWRHHGGPGGRQ